MKPTSAATVSKRRPIEVLAADANAGAQQRRRLTEALRKVERRPRQVGNIVELLEETRRGLHRVPGGRVAARHAHRAQARDAVEAVAHAADEDLTAPRAAVIAVAGAVEARTDHARVPLLALGEHRREMRAMMLNRMHDRRSASRSAHAVER